MADRRFPVGILSGTIPGISWDEHEGPSLAGGEIHKKTTLGKMKDHPYTVNLPVMENLGEKDAFEGIQTIGWVQPNDVEGGPSQGGLTVLNNPANGKKFRFSPQKLGLNHLVGVAQLTWEVALSKVQTLRQGS